MIIDMHTSLCEDDPELLGALAERGVPTPEACTTAATLKRLDGAGVDRSVVWKIGASTEECRRNNDFVVGECERHPDRLTPFATVYPYDVDAAVAEVDRAVLQLGVAGIKLHPNVMAIPMDHPGFVAVVRHVASLNMPFVTHVNKTLGRDLPDGGSDDGEDTSKLTRNAEATRLRALVQEYDSTRFQAAHMGGVYLPDIQQTGITFQTTGASRDVIQWAVDTVGAQRVVFGSDFPFFTVEDELAKVQALDVSADEREAIMSGNALSRVLSLPADVSG